MWPSTSTCCPWHAHGADAAQHSEVRPGLQIVAASALVAGQEIHNTYGEYGNSELVYKYGFALSHNPFDSVSIDKPRLLDIVKTRLQPEALDARCSFLNEFRCPHAAHHTAFGLGKKSPIGFTAVHLFVERRIC